MKAYLKQYRQSPRKVRLVADQIRGKDVEQAFADLNFLAKRAALPLKKLLHSAVMNALNNFGAQKEHLFVSEIRVDEGRTLKRYRPRARGRASAINKRTSNISIKLTQRASQGANQQHKVESGNKSTKEKDVKIEKKVAQTTDKATASTKKTEKKTPSKKD